MLDSKRYFLIAEIGINHNGCLDTARELIVEAANAGASAVKFQYRNLSRAYGENSNEIGDEILKREIFENYISPEDLLCLLEHGKREKLKVGISFFDFKDIEDFGSKISEFDFFKIPSVELTNLELINALLKFDKTVFISTGAHSEEEIERTFNALPKSGWVPLHCVSNYPVIDINAKLGYIEFMRKKWGRDVGYSSHDKEWEVCLLAIGCGVRILERHITLDKSAIGLDHSTSSTPQEFKRLSTYLAHSDLITSGNSPRSANQGELINRQNLGKSFFALREVSENEKVELNDFAYRHPNTGVSRFRFGQLIGKPITRRLKKGDVLTESNLLPPEVLDIRTVAKCNELLISLPIRLHDYLNISRAFCLNNYELHLSFGELDRLQNFLPDEPKHRFSIHLPDYLNSKQLINPFSINPELRRDSREAFSKVANFASRLLEAQNGQVLLVSSLSIVDTNKEDFYSDCKTLQDDFARRGLTLCFQWLPPFAWYFGGSEPLNAFNKEEDLPFILKNKLNICLDTSHLLMGANFFGFKPEFVVGQLAKLIRHYHFADARGFDGEGYQLGEGDISNLDFLLSVIAKPEVKVVEVWQGHLDLYAGFYKALRSIAVRF
jgi:sialic acid synthase SpsE/sugar phosphate isomerase/epimerase